MAGKKGKRKQVHVKTAFSSPSPRQSPSQPASCDSEAGSSASSLTDGANDSHPSSDAPSRRCRHIGRGVAVDKIFAHISKPKFSFSHCQDCAKETKSGAGKKGKGRSNRRRDAAANGNSEGHPSKKWLCLACGHVACGAFVDLADKKLNENGAVRDQVVPAGHASKHSQLSRHPLAFQATDNLVWCFVCNMAVDCRVPSGNHTDNPVPITVCSLQSVLKVVQEKLVNGTNFLKDPGKELLAGNTVQGDSTQSSLNDLHLSGMRRKRVVKGLMNLGNTCFFNSVMQNLLALDMLRDYFSQEFPEMEGPLSSSLRKLYLETNLDGDELLCMSTLKLSGYESGLRKGAKGRSALDNAGSVCNPRALFGAICAKAPRFRGFQQHDSHELLRCLLDGLTSEEHSARNKFSRISEDTDEARSASLERRQFRRACEHVIAESSDAEMSEQTTPSAVSSTTAVDKFFSGQLCSTVCCCDCGHSSVVFETMLDLSLPIPNPKKGQTSGFHSKASPLGEVLQQRSHKPMNDLPDSSLNKVLQPSGTSAVDVNKICLQGGQSAEAALTLPVTPSSSTQPAGTTDFGWLDFVDGGMQSAESSAGKSSAPEITAEVNESSINVDSRDSSAEVVDNARTISSTVCADQEVFEGGSRSVISNSGEQGSNVFTEKAGLAESTNSENKTVDTISALCEGEDGPLPVASGTLFLPYEPSNTSRTTSAVLNTAPNSSSEDLSSPLPEFEGGYLDGFSLLFEEEESCFVASESSRSHDNVEDSQAVESAWEERNYELASQTVADGEDTFLPLSLEGCLSDFTKPELLFGENAWECDNCTRQLMEKALLMRCENSANGADNGEASALEHQNGSIVCDSSTADLNRVSEQVFSEVCEGTERGAADSLHQTEGIVAETITEGQGFESAVQCNGSATSIHPAFNCRTEEARRKGCNGSKGLKGGEHAKRSRKKMEKEAKSKSRSGKSSEKVVRKDATKRLSISKAPPILTVHLKRFAQDMRGRLSKLSGHISFPEILDLRPFLDPRYLDSNSCLYQLIGVVEHGGTMRGGHYIAYVRSSNPEEAGDCTVQDGIDAWYCISDSSVRKASLQAVLNSEAYLLFYEKCDVVSKDDQ